LIKGRDLRPAQNKRARLPPVGAGESKGERKKEEGKERKEKKKEKEKTGKYLTHSLGGVRDFKSGLFRPQRS